MSKYVYNEIVYNTGKFKIKEYYVHYEYYFKDNLYYIYVVNYEDNRPNYGVINKSLPYAKALLREKLKKDYKKGIMPALIKDDFKIYVHHESIFKDIQQNVAYHITSTENLYSILEKGLIPNFETDIEVTNANILLDSVRKKNNIPETFSRNNVVFLHPTFDNEFVTYNEYYKNNVIFAVDITGIDGYVASSGLSGLCMYSEEFNYNKKDLKKYANAYWKYSVTLKDYQNNNLKKTPYEYSELITNNSFKPDKIKIIGFWDSNGNFIKTEYFYNFIKEKYLKNYNEILNLY